MAGARVLGGGPSSANPELFHLPQVSTRCLSNPPVKSVPWTNILVFLFVCFVYRFVSRMKIEGKEMDLMPRQP